MKKILILGAKGMAGHTICLYFIEKGYDVTGFTTTPINYCKNITGNALHFNSLKKVISKGNYDIIINCIGILNQNAEKQKAKAILLNSYLPHFIVDITSKCDTKLIHMSTDCVFSGNTGPYFEDSLRDGKSFYDRTKALGEICDNKNLTIRTSIIGPDQNINGIGLFNWFLKQDNEIFGYSKAMWTGVTTLTLAKAMERAIIEDLTGIFNLVNNTSISKYDLLQLFNLYFRNNSIDIKKNDTFILDKSLICTRNDFSFNVPSYEDMIIEMKDWINKYITHYPSFYKI